MPIHTHAHASHALGTVPEDRLGRMTVSTLASVAKPKVLSWQLGSCKGIEVNARGNDLVFDSPCTSLSSIHPCCVFSTRGCRFGLS